MKRRIAKKIHKNLPRLLEPGEPRYGRYTRDQVRQAMATLFPPRLLRVWMPRIRLIENQTLPVISERDEAVFLAALAAYTSTPETP